MVMIIGFFAEDIRQKCNKKTKFGCADQEVRKPFQAFGQLTP
jgi:hypothetical protein